MSLEHDLFVYRSDDAYVSTLAPFLREGVAAGEGVVVATTVRNIEVLRRAVGKDADEMVFVPSTEVYRSPQAAVAAYHGILEQLRRAGKPSVRAIGEVLYGDDRDAWMRWEPLAHMVFSASPLHVICPYDERSLPGALIEHAERTHPHVHDGGGCVSSTAYVDAATMLRGLPHAFPFGSAREPDLALEVTGDDLRDARVALGALLARALPPDRADDAAISIAEVITNGLRHGTGTVRASAWTLDDAFVCVVGNDGPPIDDPVAGYRPPRDPESGGMGLWVTRQLADAFDVGHDDRGPVVSVAFLR